MMPIRGFGLNDQPALVALTFDADVLLLGQHRFPYGGLRVAALFVIGREGGAAGRVDIRHDECIVDGGAGQIGGHLQWRERGALFVFRLVGIGAGGYLIQLGGYGVTCAEDSQHKY